MKYVAHEDYWGGIKQGAVLEFDGINHYYYDEVKVTRHKVRKDLIESSVSFKPLPEPDNTIEVSHEPRS